MQEQAKQDKSKAVLIRMSHDLYDQVKQCAEEDHRTVTNFVSITLKKAIERQQSQSVNG